MPGASTAEILLKAIDKLQLTVEKTADLAAIQPALDSLKSATANFTKISSQPAPEHLTA
jgi:hypothetical protein